TLIRALVILAAGWLLFHRSFAPSSWWLLTAVFLLTLLALYSLGMVFAAAFQVWGREALHIISLLQEPVYLLSGLSFPVKMAGAAVASGVALLPLTTDIDAIRQILFPRADEHGLLPVEVEVILLAVMSLALLLLSRHWLRYLERRAREEGHLTTRLQ